MPNMFITLPAGAFDREAQALLVKKLNAAAAEAEQIPDDPAKRFLCWVTIETVEPGRWTCGGQDVTDRMLPVIAVIRLPDGVLSAEMRARYVSLVDEAFKSALPSSDTRRIVSSVILEEVPDGQWGAGGAIWTLPVFAKRAGFAHLQHLVKT